MRAVIIEDEPRAARRLDALIKKVAPSIEVLAHIESITDAIEFFNSTPDIDLVFSDIQLADGLSFEIFKNLTSIPPVIFTTAYDQYAIKAFKNNGIDYILKPIDEEELKNAITKLNSFVKPTVDSQILAALANQLNGGNKTYKDRFMVKVGQHLKSITCHQIQAFYSLEKATYIFTGDARNYILDHSLDYLQETINPAKFFRINRKFILNIDAKFEITAWTNSRLKISIPGYNQEEIIVARNRVKDFKQWLGES